MALFFAILFYKNYIGINLLIFEIAAVTAMFFINKPVKLNFFSGAILGSVALSAIMVVLLNTSWSIFINIFMLFTLSSVLAFTGFRSYIHAFGESFLKIFSSQVSIFLPWKDEPVVVKTNRKSTMNFSKVIYLILIPVVIVILFLIIYASASSVFYRQFEEVFKAIGDFFRSIDFLFVVMIIFGLIVGNVLFMKMPSIGLHGLDLKSTDGLSRTKKRHYSPFKVNGLKMQYLSGIVLLASLNVLIFYFNILDFIFLWFGFKWDGSFLKEFVHEGTWLLVFSVFLSSAIALFFFKGNLNFFSKNIWLKRLTIAWIAQNIVMVFSVMLRNYWYIQYFGLAYKRIAVLFFLLLTLIGLITIIIKILNKKSSYYLWRVNGLALIFVLALTTCVNWDLHIARYNMKHCDRALIDLRFMAKLNNSALPYTLKTPAELEELNAIQEKAMPFDIHQDYLWDIFVYETAVFSKRERFLDRYQHMNWLEWNLADYQTYKKLQAM
jgi:hypothetical protein